MLKPHAAYVAIVDDDASVRKALARLLSACAITSQTYGSAREFLDSLPAGVPECLIVDLHMPEMTGLELQGELARTGARIPTIVITAQSETGYREQCRAAGAAAYLLKPLDKNTLIAAIKMAVEKG
ncbi:MAG TPA: response regulator [Xanthobacteraceae bacterium]|jgi:FixJ family two-component response regulator|nr:response regulator [Xanthobacteraceae bacterium]